MFKDLMQTVGLYLTSFTVFSGDIKKKKKSSDHFQSFFIYFFPPPDPKSEFFPVNQLIKKFWPYLGHSHTFLESVLSTVDSFFEKM